MQDMSVASIGAPVTNQGFEILVDYRGYLLAHCFSNGAEGGSISVGAWNYAAITYDGTTVKDYLNGQLVGAAALALNTASTALHIGGPPLFNSYFKGDIDDVRIYSRALADYEVYDQYAAGR